MYYVKVVTRSSGGSARGTPRQALDYITDGHDARRDPGCSKAELAYIARMGEGWKRDLEGGRVPLVGLGVLRDVKDEEELTARFEGACQPWHDRRGSTGYKSFTFTLPKEVSLFAEGHREEAKAAMGAAVDAALAAAFPGKDLVAVGAVHTRNEAGEIHFHAHVLVAKFARDRATGRVFSLNSQAGGNNPKRIGDLKAAWKEAIDRELAARLGLGVRQHAPHARPALVLPGGRKLPALNRESRRLLDKQLSPTFTETLPDGRKVRRVFRLSEAMDGRIFEVAAGAGGAGWSREGFLAIAPDQARYLGRYEKRVETLKKIGYLTPDGKVTPAFRLHYGARTGADSPELQRLRLELGRTAARESKRLGRPSPVPDLWEAVDRYESIRRRVERLGFSREDLLRIHEEARRRKPTPNNLRAIRKQVERRALIERPRRIVLPSTKGVLRAFCALQLARARAIYLLSKGVLRLQYTRHKRLADALRARAKRELFYAKERRLAQVGRVLRPVFWATRVVLPRETRRLELALARSMGLAASQEALARWQREHIERPRAALQAAARKLERPAQQAMRPQLEQARAAIPKHVTTRDGTLVQRGLEVLRRHQPELAAELASWSGREQELAERVREVARGQTDRLAEPQYRAALRAGRIGSLLEREKETPPAWVPARLATFAPELIRASARMRAFGLPDPFRRETLESLAPQAVSGALAEIRTAGLLEKGDGWTLRASGARELVSRLTPTLAAQARRQKGLGE